jgi:CheY-like chemotaxis protein
MKPSGVSGCFIEQTAFTFSNDREKSLEAGCNDYIAKPTGQAELMEIIKKYFNTDNQRICKAK